MKNIGLTSLLSLPLLLAACGGSSTPGSSSVSVVASKSTIALSSTGASVPADTGTTFTFTNKAGAAAVQIDTATIKYGADQTLNVSLAGFTVPSGISCADGSTSGCSTANLQFTEKTFAKILADADFFGKLPGLNPGLTSFPVEVSFAGVANTLTFTVNVGSTGGQTGGGDGTNGNATASAPVPVFYITSSKAAPYSGDLNVTVSGNFDASSTVDRVVLQTTDANGIVDNTTYTSNQPSATFSLDTTKFPDGNVSLKAIAITKTDAVNTKVLRGESVAKTVAVQNITAPVIALASPTDGSTVTTPTMPVQISVTRKNSAFTFPSGQMVVELIDYRGQQVATQTISGVQDNVNGTYDTSFEIGGLPVDTYTLKIKTLVAVAGGPVQTVTTIGSVTTKSVSLNPPASVIRFPITTTTNGIRSPALVDSSSGFFATVSDNLAIQYVEARIVGPYPVGNIETDGTKQCQSSGAPVGTPLDVLLLNIPGAPLLPYQTQDVFAPNLDIDGSTYVPDNVPGQRYDLRVTVADSEGNRNIQCVPVVIQRRLGTSPSTYTTTTETTPGTLPKGPTLSNGTWTLGGISNNSRVSAVSYANGVQKGTSFFASVVGSISVSQNFENAGNYEVKWLIEDMTTGVVTTVNGQTINVGTNP